ncbi:nuclease [Sphingomonas sp.]|uniref:thermonuclease family protein n=1 Tax=Sphingomonas sp. TaxID=28214 RepID=UPI0033415521
MNWRNVLIIAALAAAGFAAPARADPCESALPSREGTVFSGTVRYVGDGDSLCVGRTGNPAEWIEVRLADFNAPELHEPGGSAGKQALERLVLGRPVTCTTERGRSGRVISFDRVIARCRTGQTNLGDLLRAAGISEGGH